MFIFSSKLVYCTQEVYNTIDDTNFPCFTQYMCSLISACAGTSTVNLCVPIFCKKASCNTIRWTRRFYNLVKIRCMFSPLIRHPRGYCIVFSPLVGYLMFSPLVRHPRRQFITFSCTLGHCRGPFNMFNLPYGHPGGQFCSRRASGWVNAPESTTGCCYGIVFFFIKYRH